MKANKRSGLAQNRIDYIVYGNPKGAAQLVYDYGYQPPRHLRDLAGAVRLLVQKKGRKALRRLISLHPDRAAILKVDREKEDHYCGACHSYSYNPHDNYCTGCGHSNYNDQDDTTHSFVSLTDMGTDRLKAHYESMVRKSNNNPEDTALAEQVQTVWNALRQSKLRDATEEEQKSDLRGMKEDLLIASLLFVAGILVGSALTKT